MLIQRISVLNSIIDLNITTMIILNRLNIIYIYFKNNIGVDFVV